MNSGTLGILGGLGLSKNGKRFQRHVMGGANGNGQINPMAMPKNAGLIKMPDEDYGAGSAGAALGKLGVGLAKGLKQSPTDAPIGLTQEDFEDREGGLLAQGLLGSQGGGMTQEDFDDYEGGLLANGKLAGRQELDPSMFERFMNFWR